MIDKEPPVPKTNVMIREEHRDDNGCVTLKIIPENGDTVHWEIEANATSASSLVKDTGAFKTSEMQLSFICEDSTGKHETGPAVEWFDKNVSVKYRFFDGEDGIKRCELKASNSKNVIMYSTDGSQPKDGAVYNEPFTITGNASILLAVPYYKPLDLYGRELQVKIPRSGKGANGTSVHKVEIDNDTPLILRKNIKQSDSEVYHFIEDMKQMKLIIVLGNLCVTDINNDDCYVDITASGNRWSVDKFEKTLETLRNVAMSDIDTKVTATVEEIHFKSGLDFRNWVAKRQEEISKYADAVIQ